jgi:SNF2 family DNA or RNA helicase
MGKTIISLALVLENPAPPLPESGSIVPDAFPSHHEAGLGWDPDMKASLLSSGSNSKRARILSRGTLVICHVSLVGQWCEEAKRRLIAPGMVYPYHGGCRKRDPKTLAANSIVVTTYATLASDVNYHGKGIDGHVSPCEQIRWWRIIVDESHTMKTTGTKQSQAVLNLVADHKWAVTGTPVNTSLSDISNQLRLIGIENVAEYFELFRETVFKIVKDSSFSTGNRRRRRSYDCRTNYELFGPFVFFMRTLMIRHSKKMKYLGTDTELMALPEKVRIKSGDKPFSDSMKLVTYSMFPQD